MLLVGNNTGLFIRVQIINPNFFLKKANHFNPVALYGIKNPATHYRRRDFFMVAFVVSSDYCGQ